MVYESEGTERNRISGATLRVLGTFEGARNHGASNSAEGIEGAANDGLETTE